LEGERWKYDPLDGQRKKRFIRGRGDILKERSKKMTKFYRKEEDSIRSKKTEVPTEKQAMLQREKT